MENLTIIVPFWNGHHTINRLLASLPIELPILIIDDQSDKALHLNNLFRDRQITVIRPDKKGYFTGAVNYGIDRCDTDVLVINQDVRFEGEQWLDLIAQNRERYALIGERIHGEHPAWPMGYIHGTFMYMRRDAINKVGKMNGREYPLWGSTCEWQLRICRNGFQVLPVQEIPGMIHERVGNFGSSISEILKREPQNYNRFIQTPPKISVIIPTYNHGKYLSDAVNSLIGGSTSLGEREGQTFQSFEVIIVDDYSTDDTQEIARSLADPWKGVRYIRRNSNGGTPAANNTGIRNSFGNFITVLCADDMMKPDRLEYLYRVVADDPSIVAYDDFTLFREGQYFKGWQMKEYDFEDLLEKNFIHAGIMFSRQAWNDVGGYPEVMKFGREDWAFNIALGVHGYCGKRVPIPGYLYRREGQNRTLRNTNPHWRAKFKMQLWQLFPHLYAGDRPMRCCGGRKRATKKGSKANKMSKAQMNTLRAGAIAESGKTILQYVGKNYGTEVYFGHVTGKQYKFGLNRSFGEVDNRDLLTQNSRKPGLLEIVEGGRKLFVIHKPKPVIVSPVEKKDLTVRTPLAELDPIGTPVTTIGKIVSTETPLPEDIDELELTDIQGVGKVTAQKLQEAGYPSPIYLAQANVQTVVSLTDLSVSKVASIKNSAKQLLETVSTSVSVST